MASEAALSLLAVTLQPFLAAILGILEAVLATIILARWWLPALYSQKYEYKDMSLYLGLLLRQYLEFCILTLL